MDDDFGVWVESMGAASGWKLWVWLEYRVVVSGCCYKEVHVYNYIDILIIIITFPYSPLHVCLRVKHERICISTVLY